MTFRFKAIDHIQLAAPKGSEDKARKFFHGLLHFEEVEKPQKLKKNGGVWFASGHIQLHIGIEDPFNASKKAHPAFEVEDLSALKEYLLEREVDFKEDDNLPGAKRFYVFDPFGNRLEFLEWDK